MSAPKQRVKQLKQRFNSRKQCVVKQMKPFLLLFKLFGMFANGITNDRLKRCSWPFYVICVFWVAAYISYTLFLLCCFVEVESISIRLSVDFLKHLLGYISLSVNIIAAYFSQNQFSKFFDRLDSYDHEVAQLGNERRDNLLVYWIATLLTIIIIIVLLNVITGEKTEDYIMFLVTLSDICTMCMHISGTLEKFLLLYLILERFKHLNEKIVPYISWDEKRHKSKPIKITEVKILYSLLYDAQQAFSDIYTNPFLFWFASLMIHIVANIHFFREKEILVASALVGSPIMQLLILCSICHYTAKEANNISFVLHENMTSLSNSEYTMAKIGTLTYFLHKRVFFEAGGYFTIDLPLFQSTIAAITTYFIVLI